MAKVFVPPKSCAWIEGDPRHGATLATLSSAALAALRDNARRISTQEATTEPQPLFDKGKGGQVRKVMVTLKPNAQLIATAGEILPAIEAELSARRVRHLKEAKD